MAQRWQQVADGFRRDLQEEPVPKKARR
jgi:hypothetical protein